MSSPAIPSMVSARTLAVSKASVKPEAEPSATTSWNGAFWDTAIITCWSLALGPSATSQTWEPGLFLARLAAS